MCEPIRYTQRMGKIGGLGVVAVMALTGCAASPPAATMEPAANVQPAASVQSNMLAELRPLLTTLKASDSELLSEAYSACANLLFRDKDAYREAILAKYPDPALGLDHLTVAAAGKQHLCR